MTLAEAIKILTDAGVPSPEYDAKELMHRFGGIGDPVIPKNYASDSPEFIDAVNRRAAREPLQYIIGTVGFYREEYKVTPDCLIPRSDTEILVDYAVKNIPESECFLDLCSGSGCIGISTLANTGNTYCISADISSEALKLTLENAEKNGVRDRLSAVKCDLLRDKPVINKKIYAVLSNPPYVKSEDYQQLDGEIYYEPKNAFLGGDDGLDFYRILIPFSMETVCEGGFAAFEIGYDQAEDIKQIAHAAGFRAEILKDYSGNDRVAIIKKT